ncbi:hypothetical protein LVD15_12295 [Fulvivirga maritima]|uniref:hypothetical protein n=1 Tax=Fulvivirga maritima TaxID=2904247 RepID=UPI001F226533|nr:hypothetical protein [Fulvivirga maritima]UII29171.1 hypothetical protein LVD15_12295 [Fulvivirga maritima]
MALISKKKKTYTVSPQLHEYLKENDREIDLPISYADLQRYNNSISLLDKNDKDTLWETVFYPQADMVHIHDSLKKIYAIIKADGDLSVMQHLFVDRIDLCVYGNTQPFRARIVNQINDNFDYFYIKNADASRIYGLELEHLLSPNRISYVVDRETLIEEHIVGIPGDQFMKHHINSDNVNKIRLSKEFVKFNERCFVRLLGDMHSSNFVIDITPDFEDVDYRIRAIDFDQQSYEGRKSIYLPQYFKQNNPLIQMGINCMTPETVKQYQKEERFLIGTRYKASKVKIKHLLSVMGQDTISTPENINTLKTDLFNHYKNKDFLKCSSMGDILKVSLDTVLQQNPPYQFPIE